MGPYWLQATHDDFDAFVADAPGFHLQVRQLDRGRYASNMRAVVGERVQVSWANFARNLEMAGDLPHATRTFVVSTEDAITWTWRGRVVRGTDLLTYPPGAHIDLISPAGWSAFAVSIDEDYLGVLLQREGIEPARVDGQPCRRLPVGRLQVLRRLLALILRAPPGMDATHALEVEVPHALLRLLREGSEASAGEQDARGLLVERARRFIRAHAHDAPSVADVESALGASGRTLRRAFRERVGVSPKAYVHAQRLHAARVSLRQSQGSVSDVAGRFGFWHMGQFAADYRRQFGELPSATLQATRRRR